MKRIPFLPIALLAIYLQPSLAENAIKLDAMEAAIADQTLKQITSVVAMQRGELVYEGYFNGADAQTLHDVRSASKTVTSLLMGIAIHQKAVPSVDVHALDWFADKKPLNNPDPRKTSIDIEDLLSMSSLMECNDWNQFSRGNEERMYLIEDWSAFFWNLPIRGIPPWESPANERPYGRAHSYCTAGVFVLGELIQRATDTELTEYAERFLFAPLGIKEAVWPRSPMGIAQGGGGLRLSSRSLISLGQLMLDDGKRDDQQIIPKSWIKSSWTRRAQVRDDVDYGYLWWIFDFETGQGTVTAYAMAGNGGNYVFVVPEFNGVAVVTSTAYNTSYMHDQSHSILTDHIIKAWRRAPAQ